MVDPLDKFARESAADVETLVVMKTDVESAHRFLSVFEFDLPVFLEGNLIWPGEDPIAFVPYWLLYDTNGHLALKGVIEQPNGMTILTSIVRKEVAQPAIRVG